MAARPNKSARVNQFQARYVVASDTSLPLQIWSRLTGKLEIDVAKLQQPGAVANAEILRVHMRLGERCRSHRLPEDLLSIVSEPRIPIEHRCYLVQGLTHRFWESAPAATNLLGSAILAGSLEVEVIRAFLQPRSGVRWYASYGAPFADALQVLLREDYPVDLRQTAYTLLWIHCLRSENGERRSLLPRLLREADARDLGSALSATLSYEPSAGRVQNISSDESRLVAQWLASGKGHPLVRALLAIMYSPGLNEETLISAFMSIFEDGFADDHSTKVIADALGFLPWDKARACARAIIQNDLLPPSTRWTLLPHIGKTDIAELFVLARDSRLTETERRKLAARIFEQITKVHVSGSALLTYLQQLAGEDNALWRDVIDSDCLGTSDPGVIRRLIADAKTPPLVAVLATLVFPQQTSASSTDSQTIADIATVLSAPRFPSEVRGDALGILTGITPAWGAQCVLSLAGQTALPVRDRLDYLGLKPFRLAISRQLDDQPHIMNTVWQLALNADHALIRKEALAILRTTLRHRLHSDFLYDYLMEREDAAAKQLSEGGARQHQAETLDFVRGIELFFLSYGDGWTKDQLLDAALSSEQSPGVRIAALRKLFDQPQVSNGERSQLLRIARRDPQPLVRKQALALVGFKIPYLVTHTQLLNDPESPFWTYFQALLQFPDNDLARGFLHSFDPEKLLPNLGPESTLQNWIRTTLGDVPAAAVLPVLTLLERDAPLLNPLFHNARRRASLTNELTTLLLDLTGGTTGVTWRMKEARELIVGSLSERLAVAEEISIADIINQLRCVSLAATVRDHIAQNGYEIPGRRTFPFRKRSPGLRITDVQSSQSLDTLCERFEALLVHARSPQIRAVAQQTPAPLILAAHYLATYPKGLPLLGKAIEAASEGIDAWKKFRYETPESRKQLKFLSSKDLHGWQENLRAVDRQVTTTTASQEVARRLRACFRQALDAGVFAAEVRALIPPDTEEDVGGVLARYRLVQREIGRIVNGERGPLGEDDLRDLPEAVANHVKARAADTARSNLLAIGKHVRAASDLIRLIHLDDAALYRNDLVAEGELPAERDDGNRPRLVARLGQLEHLLRNPYAREGQSAASGQTSRIEETFQTARDLVLQVGKFASRSSLVVEECDDFQTLIEIGHNPFGQNSCQDYTSAGRYNSCLLGYVVDAMTKAIVIRRVGSSGSDGLIARSIAKVCEPLDGGPPILLLERVYPRDFETQYGPMLFDAARQFGEKRGWRVAHADETRSSGVKVRISASRNGRQYEDAANSESNAMPSGAYVLSVKLDDPFTRQTQQTPETARQNH